MSSQNDDSVSKLPHDEVQIEEKDGTVVATEYMGTAADKKDMHVLGKKQILRRNFKFITILALTTSATCTWEYIITVLVLVLSDGGRGSIFWGYIVGTCGMTLVYASLAELASISPTAGGQYHWVSEFAPPRMQKLLSYLVGWLCAIAWQVFTTASCYIAALIIQGLLILNVSNYEPHPFHATLLTIAIIAFAILINTIFATRLPYIEGAVFILHIAGFFAIAVPLWVLAPRSGRDSLIEFNNAANWPSTGLSALIGFTAPLGTLVGYDASVHMSEEVQDASLTLPRSLMWAVFPSSLFGILMAITLDFTIGDVDAVLATPTGEPFIQIFYNATKSHVGTSLMASILIVLVLVSCVSSLATASRQLWSFGGRDRGLPGSWWLAVVTPGWNIPARAVSISLVVTSLLACINLGSSVALNAICSLSLVSVLSSYFITISCIVWRRLRGAPLPYRRWSLGKYGLAINILALMYLIPAWFFTLFPLFNPVTTENMNWGSLMFSSIILFALIWYALKGRFEYTGPVVLVKREE